MFARVRHLICFLLPLCLLRSHASYHHGPVLKTSSWKGAPLDSDLPRPIVRLDKEKSGQSLCPFPRPGSALWCVVLHKRNRNLTPECSLSTSKSHPGHTLSADLARGRTLSITASEICVVCTECCRVDSSDPPRSYRKDISPGTCEKSSPSEQLTRAAFGNGKEIIFNLTKGFYVSPPG